MVYNLLIAGVGGQGTLLAGKIMGAYAQQMNMDVKVSEVHGMAQRGGGVVTQVRFGESVDSPLVGEGQADAIIAFEPLEMLRWVHYLKPGGVAVCTRDEVMPLSVAMGNAVYPEDVEAQIEARAEGTRFINALAEAEKCGTARAMNVVLLGAFAKLAKLDESAMEKALEACVKPQFLNVNLRALRRGMEIAANA